MAKRVIIIILDSVGIGYAPDAKAYGDSGASTLAHTAQSVGGLKIPNMQRMGLGNIEPKEILGCPPNLEPLASYGRMTEINCGKDTTTGHWEMIGCRMESPFATFPNGFPEDFLRKWMKETGVPGYLCNRPISGTVVIKELGEEHLKTGFPIVYTSADSVFQIAAHEERFGLERLYEVCRVTRSLVDELNVGRVIARPFVGTKADDFTRTPRRRDYSMDPPSPNLLTLLSEKGLPFYAIGKIEDIYAKVGVTKAVHTVSNADGMKKLMEAIKEQKNGLIFANLVDFDMLYGHRRDPVGYAKCLEEFDELLGSLLLSLGRDDYLFISADHGLDPTYKGTDHTRERVPLLFYSPSLASKDLGTRETFADLGATVAEILELSPLAFGRSVLV
ncbi:phosphopentomutase [bacterium]|nr:phosphopentomutase [bacterium]